MSTNPAPTPLASTAMAAHTLEQTLGFFRSVIMSGESWSSSCDKEYEDAQAQLAALRAEVSAFQPLLAKVEGERDAGMEILDTVARGFERSLGRLLVDDKAGAERELKLAIAHVDNPHGYTGKSMAALRADLAAKEAALAHYAHADFLTTEQQKVADNALQSHAK